MSGSSAASMFGGALTGASAGNFLTKTTAWLATAFFIISALLALVVSKTDQMHRNSELRQELVAPVQPTESVPPISTPTVPEN